MNFSEELFKDMAKKLLRKVVTYLEEKKIEYTITGGTLLGFVRNKKFIPYDDDMDLDIHIPLVSTSKNTPKNTLIRNPHTINYNTMKIEGLKCIEYSWGIKVMDLSYPKNLVNKWKNHIGRVRYELNQQGILQYFNRSQIMEFAKYSYNPSQMIRETIPSLDLFFMKNGRYIDRDEKPSKEWENCYHTYNELYPIKDGIFEGIRVKVPNKPNGYLDRAYPDWKTKYKQIYDHNLGKVVNTTHESY